MLRGLAIGIVVMTLSGCVALTGRTTGQFVDDKTITGTVKTRLVLDRLQNLSWVDVDTNQGVVYLTGNAKTAAQKARATELAMETKGVRQVVNNIAVRDEATAVAPRSSTARGAAAPAASPPTAGGPVTGEVVDVDRGNGSLTLRMADGSNAELRLPPASLPNVRPGDRLTVSVSPAR
jgi:hypothetical protein